MTLKDLLELIKKQEEVKKHIQTLKSIIYYAERQSSIPEEWIFDKSEALLRKQAELEELLETEIGYVGCVCDCYPCACNDDKTLKLEVKDGDMQGL